MLLIIRKYNGNKIFYSNGIKQCKTSTNIINFLENRKNIHENFYELPMWTLYNIFK